MNYFCLPQAHEHFTIPIEKTVFFVEKVNKTKRAMWSVLLFFT